jgi:hypothetical protein
VLHPSLRWEEAFMVPTDPAIAIGWLAGFDSAQPHDLIMLG